MKRTHLIPWTAIVLSCVGMFTPQAVMASPAAPRQSRATAVDIQLQEGSVFQGLLVSAAGSPLGSTKVVILEQGRPVAEVFTDEDGRFTLGPLRGGTYQVVTARSAGVYRLWAPRTAPPAARPMALLVEGDNVLRGQTGTVAMFLSRPWVMVGIIGAAIAVPIAVHNRDISS